MIELLDWVWSGIMRTPMHDRSMLAALSKESEPAKKKKAEARLKQDEKMVKDGDGMEAYIIPSEAAQQHEAMLLKAAGRYLGCQHLPGGAVDVEGVEWLNMALLRPQGNEYDPEHTGCLHQYRVETGNEELKQLTFDEPVRVIFSGCDD